MEGYKALVVLNFECVHSQRQPKILNELQQIFLCSVLDHMGGLNKSN